MENSIKLKESFTENHKFKIYESLSTGWLIGYKPKKGFTLFWKNVEEIQKGKEWWDTLSFIDIQFFRSRELALEFLEGIGGTRSKFESIEHYQLDLKDQLKRIDAQEKKEKAEASKPIYL